ncbi:transmembrane protein 176A [Cavia porcellus]|uniref:Transmembrane protein 176A n=1 Tax=Cavia porcellus TaxID=10141 RepID=H0V9Y6_CAVPO|nr:transmembrane protein 176A [Cavia porcellus]XP_005003544.1 transmembrane protein 176A [Cavia porcellus]
MDAGTGDSNEVAPEGPQPTHINVHIHKESALAKILLTGCSLLRLPASATSATSRLLVASWVVQIMLGLLSGVLGGFLYIFQCRTLCTSGAALWTGVVAVLAGAAAFVYNKRGGICWALLKILLTLAAFCTAVAAIKIGAGSFHEYRYDMGSDYNCKDSYWPTVPPSTSRPELERLHLCISQMNMLKNLIVSLQSMLLGVWVLLLLASLAPLCLYCWRRFSIKKKREQPKEATGKEPVLALPLLGTHT